MAKKTSEKTREAAQAIIRGAKEPLIVAGPAYNRTMIEYLNYHNAHSDAKDKRKWLYTHLYKAGKDDFVEVLHDASDYEVGQLGALCRALDRGDPLSSKHRADIQTRTAKLVLKYANATLADDEIDEERGPKVDRNELVARGFYAEYVQDIVDAYVEFARSNLAYEPPSMKTLLVLHNINAAQAEIIGDLLAGLLEELTEALSGKDEDLKEAYSGWTKKQLQAFQGWVLQMVQACIERSEVVKATRKPRVVKAKPKASPVAKLKYQQSFPELNLRSIDPEAILKATELFCYRTENRRLVYFKAVAGKTLNVSGQTMENVDETLSGSKTIRKPEAFFKGLNTAKKALMQAYENVPTAEGDAPARIMGDMILLKAF